MNVDSKKELPKIKKTIKHFPNADGETKTTILLIADEYHSPEELKNISSKPVDSFSNHLIKHGWEIKNNFKSREISSIYSFASLLNFNLSQHDSLGYYPNWKIGLDYLYTEPELMKSLHKKNIKILNYGIFHLGKINPINRLYFYPTNFTELIFSNSVYINIRERIKQKNISTLSPTYSTWEAQNSLILDSLPSIINREKENKSFIYAHLFMPHSPYSFKDKVFKSNDPLSNYIYYWHFTNEKIKEMIDKIFPDSKIRIIITGDHGLRKNQKLNPHSTFAAFWGFNEEDLKKVQSVQDIGSLINAYY